MRPNAKQPHFMEYYLEGELKERFVKLFPIHSNRRLMEWFGIAFTTLQRFKRELGLAKDMTAIRKELARDVKKICEKNGYYDSIRGKAPSEACLEAARKKREEGFHPLRQIKETNPRRYKRIIKKWAEKREEKRKADLRRIKWGLEPKTKLKITLCKLSQTARSHKHAMIKSCNYFADEEHSSWVCYDEETIRSERREATAIRHGLKVIDATT